MKVEPFDADTDYLMVCQWWEHHGWPCVPRKVLPPFGWKILHEGTPVAAAWAYMDNGGTGVAMIEWVVSNPSASNRSVAVGIKRLLEFMVDTIHEEFDYDFILGSCRQDSLASLMEKVGFLRTDEDVIHLLKLKD